MAKSSSARNIQRVSLDPWHVRLWRAVTRNRSVWRDVLGMLLIAVGLITLLTLFGINTGSLIKAWAGLLQRGLGFGAYLVGLLLIGFGLPVLLGKLPTFSRATFIRIICGEVAFVAFLALTHNFSLNQNPYRLMDEGSGGGMVGWVLSEALWRALGADGTTVSLLTQVISLAIWLTLLALTGWVALGPLLMRAPSARESAQQVREAEEMAWQPEPVARGGRGRQLPLPDPDAAEEPVAKPARTTSKAAKTADASVESTRQKLPRTLQPIADVKSNPLIIRDGTGDNVVGAKDNGAGKDKEAKKKPYVPGPNTLPPIELLKLAKAVKSTEADVKRLADIIETTLVHFGLVGKVVEIRRGPTVTQFGIEPGYIDRAAPNGERRQQKIRVSQIAALQNDFALALSAASLRIEAPIPGRGLVGLEVPNAVTSTVDLRGLMQGDDFRALSAKTPLAIALGRDVSGTPINADLGRMPHLLIAGTTGSGKSVCIAAITLCLAMNNRPEDLKFVMVDPKMVELTRFTGLPHIIGKPESDIDRIPAVLHWVTKEMDDRYKKFSQIGSRNLADYNEAMVKRGEEPLPRIVLMIDELADLMMQSPIETEKMLCRLAQMARATGIHMVVATQRPSVDVVTGLIKANFPARISFAVASSTDSRVILDQVGAESLLGRGDMLFLNPENGTPMRVQGCLITEKEQDKVIEWWRDQMESEKGDSVSEKPEAPEDYVANKKPEMETPWELAVAQLAAERQMAGGGKSGRGSSSSSSDDEGGDDDLIKRAMDIIQTAGNVSTSLLQRKLRIGYPRAARLMEELQEMGYVGGASKQAGKGRDVRTPVADTEQDA